MTPRYVDRVLGWRLITHQLLCGDLLIFTAELYSSIRSRQARFSKIEDRE